MCHFVSVWFLRLFFLHGCQVLFQTVKSLIPNLSELVDPVIDFFHSIHFDLVKNLPALDARFDQIAFGKDLDVLGNG